MRLRAAVLLPIKLAAFDCKLACGWLAADAAMSRGGRQAMAEKLLQEALPDDPFSVYWRETMRALIVQKFGDKALDPHEHVREWSVRSPARRQPLSLADRACMLHCRPPSQKSNVCVCCVRACSS